MTPRMLLAPFALCLAIGLQSAEGQVVPFKGSGTNAVYDSLSGDYIGTGKSTLMGRTLLEGNIIPTGDFFPEPGIFFEGTFIGTQQLTAANGDTLAANLTGDVVLEIDPDTGLVTGTWEPFFTITGGTGRFANASGSFEGLAINPPFDPTFQFWDFDYSFDGKIDLGKKRK